MFVIGRGAVDGHVSIRQLLSKIFEKKILKLDKGKTKPVHSQFVKNHHVRGSAFAFNPFAISIITEINL